MCRHIVFICWSWKTHTCMCIPPAATANVCIRSTGCNSQILCCNDHVLCCSSVCISPAATAHQHQSCVHSFHRLHEQNIMLQRPSSRLKQPRSSFAGRNGLPNAIGRLKQPRTNMQRRTNAFKSKQQQAGQVQKYLYIVHVGSD